jgi:hypothetical protein
MIDDDKIREFPALTWLAFDLRTLLKVASLFLALLLTACAEQRWPVPGDGQMVSELPIVQQRYAAASIKSLGTLQDIADIKRRVRQEPLNPKEIRWLSPTEVMVLADWGRDLGYEEYLCVLVKKDGKWRMVECYLALVS